MIKRVFLNNLVAPAVHTKSADPAAASDILLQLSGIRYHQRHTVRAETGARAL